MLGNDYENQACSIAGALEVVGERWSLLIVRDVFLGLRRFDEIQDDLGIARNVLHTRLTRLLDHGVLERRLYQERPPRYEYRLTDKGLDLWPTIVALMKWGDRYAAPPGGPAVLLEHRGCGGAIDDHRVCERCGAKLSARDARGLPGPGARPEHPLLRRGEHRRAAERQPSA
ncbi:MAG TPA: helix-turn-helix domain-containing protein [Solirubrobacteraceae bacterium]|jgi:DNA-binding HxlR family transcriptional regulator|nr:helix-turn-helix domain-containing protein [Solirubrobacteraceae bacterium]